jgi:hypothetical protein
VTEIDVDAQPQGRGWLCRVTITDGAGWSEHRVTVARADLERYAPGASEPTDLVRRSFEFLLAREPRQSILPAFDLPVIERYFRDYPEAIRPGS